VEKKKNPEKVALPKGKTPLPRESPGKGLNPQHWHRDKREIAFRSITASEG